MPRPQRELDPDGGPLVEFARDLRALRTRAGTPKFATMARRTGRSKTALADASAGQHLPRWETVEDFVRACDGDPADWYERWLALRPGVGTAGAGTSGAGTSGAGTSGAGTSGAGTSDARSTPGAGAPGAGVPGAGPTTGEGPTTGAGSTPGPGERGAGAPGVDDRPAAPPASPVALGAPPAPEPARSRRRAVLAAAVVGVLVIGALGFVLGRVTVPGPPIVPQTVEAIEVQNKVALGPDRLVEDRTPAYLSTQALAYCASPDRSCKVPGTEMASGAAVVANCWTQGQLMWNWDLSDPTAQSNPDNARSDLWYRASFPDGRTGYLSEVYVVRGDRGGRGLPRCTP
ncbi:helix-turn-helix domain-containing protein [Actinomycetospora endophytica]|uniref:Helix-turn-helix domain-containing protein n=1 Tax=Actinomycetospora endophytica TaxID=2291215 RepID=A0ABS8PFE5_9PSEU|nr:helix-turn-helix transcriptional regulator [Actinomycetospora endophytica]MCD2196235.1 helix-turn-helix domain-containing protein [Actinomycetospora endophytica]